MGLSLLQKATSSAEVTDAAKRIDARLHSGDLSQEEWDDLHELVDRRLHELCATVEAASE
jgi:hypothetical protein